MAMSELYLDRKYELLDSVPELPVYLAVGSCVLPIVKTVGEEEEVMDPKLTEKPSTGQFLPHIR